MCTMKDFFGVMGKRCYIYIVWARTQSYGDLWKRGPLSIFRLISFYHIFLYFIIPALFLIAFNIQYFVFNKCLQALLNKTSICKNFYFFQGGVSCLSRVLRKGRGVCLRSCDHFITKIIIILVNFLTFLYIYQLSYFCSLRKSNRFKLSTLYSVSLFVR